MFKIYQAKTTTTVQTTVSAIYNLIKIYNLNRETAKNTVNAAKNSGTALISGAEIRIDYFKPQTKDACPSHRNCWHCLYADLCPVWLDTGTTPLQVSEYGEVID